MLRPDAMSRGVTGDHGHPRDRRLRSRPGRSIECIDPARLDSYRRSRRVLRRRTRVRPDRAVRRRASASSIAIARRRDRRCSAACRRSTSGGSSARRSSSVGEPARVDIQIANVGRQASPYLQLWEPVGNNGGAPMQLAKLAPGRGCQRRVPRAHHPPRPDPHRSAARRCAATCSASPSARTTLAGTDEVLDRPAHGAPAVPSIGSSGRLGQHLRMKSWGQTGSEFHSLREYVRGDDIRRINWKASARSTSLIVRETALEGIRRCTVVLDTTAGEYDGDAFEQAVIAAASVTASSAARRRRHAVRRRTRSTCAAPTSRPTRCAGWRRSSTGHEPLDAASINSGMSEGMGAARRRHRACRQRGRRARPDRPAPRRDARRRRVRRTTRPSTGSCRRRHVDRSD